MSKEHIRVVCAWPKQPEEYAEERGGREDAVPYPRLQGFLPTLADCEIYFVDKDGHAHEMNFVRRVILDTGAPGECVSARIEVTAVAFEMNAPLLPDGVSVVHEVEAPRARPGVYVSNPYPDAPEPDDGS
jgi:hypothetical protein